MEQSHGSIQSTRRVVLEENSTARNKKQIGGEESSSCGDYYIPEWTNGSEASALVGEAGKKIQGLLADDSEQGSQAFEASGVSRAHCSKEPSKVLEASKVQEPSHLEEESTMEAVVIGKRAADGSDKQQQVTVANKMKPKSTARTRCPHIEMSASEASVHLLSRSEKNIKDAIKADEVRAGRPRQKRKSSSSAMIPEPDAKKVKPTKKSDSSCGGGGQKQSPLGVGATTLAGLSAAQRKLVLQEPPKTVGTASSSQRSKTGAPNSDYSTFPPMVASKGSAGKNISSCSASHKKSGGKSVSTSTKVNASCDPGGHFSDNGGYNSSATTTTGVGSSHQISSGIPSTRSSYNFSNLHSGDDFTPVAASSTSRSHPKEPPATRTRLPPAPRPPSAEEHASARSQTAAAREKEREREQQTQNKNTSRTTTTTGKRTTGRCKNGRIRGLYLPEYAEEDERDPLGESRKLSHCEQIIAKDEREQRNRTSRAQRQASAGDGKTRWDHNPAPLVPVQKSTASFMSGATLTSRRIAASSSATSHAAGRGTKTATASAQHVNIRAGSSTAQTPGTGANNIVVNVVLPGDSQGQQPRGRTATPKKQAKPPPAEKSEFDEEDCRRNPKDYLCRDEEVIITASSKKELYQRFNYDADWDDNFGDNRGSSSNPCSLKPPCQSGRMGLETARRKAEKHGWIKLDEGSYIAGKLQDKHYKEDVFIDPESGKYIRRVMTARKDVLDESDEAIREPGKGLGMCRQPLEGTTFWDNNEKYAQNWAHDWEKKLAQCDTEFENMRPVPGLDPELNKVGYRLAYFLRHYMHRAGNVSSDFREKFKSGYVPFEMLKTEHFLAGMSFTESDLKEIAAKSEADRQREDQHDGHLYNERVFRFEVWPKVLSFKTTASKSSGGLTDTYRREVLFVRATDKHCKSMTPWLNLDLTPASDRKVLEWFTKEAIPKHARASDRMGTHSPIEHVPHLHQKRPPHVEGAARVRGHKSVARDRKY